MLILNFGFLGAITFLFVKYYALLNVMNSLHNNTNELNKQVGKISEIVKPLAPQQEKTDEDGNPITG